MCDANLDTSAEISVTTWTRGPRSVLQGQGVFVGDRMKSCMAGSDVSLCATVPYDRGHGAESPGRDGRGVEAYQRRKLGNVV